MHTNEETREHIQTAIAILRNSGDVAELRVPGTNKGTVGGYFDDYDAMGDAAAEQSGTANVFVTLNPVNPALLARASNRTMPRFPHKLKDSDILKRNWLLVKVDPIRPEGISSTDEELEAALGVASQIRDDLTKAGWPQPALASDGNGADLLYYTDLTNDEESTRTFREMLTTLDELYSTEAVKVDTSVYQATQRVRLYGTVAMVGDSTEDRPHRMSQILEWPDEFDGVTLEQLAEIAAHSQQTEAGDQNQEPAQETQTEALIRLGSEAKFFRDEIDEAYAAVDVDGHTELWKVKSKPFGLWLTRKYFEETGLAPGTDAMRQARSVMEMKAMFAGDQRKLHLRVAELDGAVYYDLADRDWRTIKVTPTGCTVLERPPILFVRYKNSQAQVEPDFEGDVQLLLDHVRVKDEYEQLLYLVYLVSCLVPDIPHPVLVLCGEKGAAKTTAARMSRAIVDPAMRGLLIMPNSTADLALSIANNYMPAFDNLDSLSSEKSDLLCTAATGGSFSKRALFTDDDEVLLSFKRCVVLNGINLVVTKPDLLDRSIILELERIAEEERKEERAIWEAFEADRPCIIGGALTVLSKAMSIYPTVQLDRLGRMADFTRWGYAIAEAMGYSGGDFLEAYAKNQGKSNEEAISAHPVASAIVALMAAAPAPIWKGTVASLLTALERVAEKEKINTHVKVWPNAAHVLSRRLKEVQSNLKQKGITFDIRHAGDARNITIRKSVVS